MNCWLLPTAPGAYGASRPSPPPAWDALLPAQARRLPSELAGIDAYLDDERFITPWRTLFATHLGRLSVPIPTLNLVALNPQPIPPGTRIRLVALNPQPLPPKTTIDFVALNPQPLPPSGTLEFVAVATRPAH